MGTLVALLAFAPARWVADALDRSGGALQLHNPQGTLWTGSGQVILRTQATDSTALGGQLEWSVRPTWFHDGPGLSVQWNAACCLSGAWQWRVVATGGGMQLHMNDLGAGQSLRVPAAVLVGLGAPWNTLAPEGQLEVTSQGLQLQRDAHGMHIKGQVQVDALRVSTSLSTLRPVGSYRLVLQGAATPTIALSTLEGALQLSGTGALHPQRIVFQGEASAAQGHEDALSNLLNIIGQRQGARSLIHLG